MHTKHIWHRGFVQNNFSVYVSKVLCNSWEKDVNQRKTILEIAFDPGKSSSIVMHIHHLFKNLSEFRIKTTRSINHNRRWTIFCFSMEKLFRCTSAPGFRCDSVFMPAFQGCLKQQRELIYYASDTATEVEFWSRIFIHLSIDLKINCPYEDWTVITLGKRNTHDLYSFL